MSDTCTHSWKTCPVHSVPEGLPTFDTVILCLYGDTTTKEGQPVDRKVARDIQRRVVDQLKGQP